MEVRPLKKNNHFFSALVPVFHCLLFDKHQETTNPGNAIMNMT